MTVPYWLLKQLSSDQRKEANYMETFLRMSAGMIASKFGIPTPHDLERINTLKKNEELAAEKAALEGEQKERPGRCYVPPDYKIISGRSDVGCSFYCNACGHEWKISKDQILVYRECPKCHGQNIARI